VCSNLVVQNTALYIAKILRKFYNRSDIHSIGSIPGTHLEGSFWCKSIYTYWIATNLWLDATLVVAKLFFSGLIYGMTIA
jgi:hypothetical protein